MFKKTKSIAAISAAVILAFTACSGTPTPDSAPATQSGTAGSSQSDGGKYSITGDREIEITWLMRDDEQVKLNTKGKFFDDVKNITGVKINAIPVIPSELSNQVQLALSSNNMPDIIQGETADSETYLSYGEQGAFIDILPLMEYAPHLKKYLDTDAYAEAVKYSTASSGKQYIIPTLKSAGGYSKMFQIRTDLLEKYKLPMPQTFEELKADLYKFQEGESAEMKKQNRPFYAFAAVTSDMEYFFYHFDVANDFFIENGKILYGPADDRYKEALTTLSEFYGKGMMPPEAFSISEDQYYELMYNGSLGLALNSTGRTDKANAAFEKINKQNGTNYHFELLPPVKSEAGKQYLNVEANYKQPIMITTSSKYPKECLQLLDWFYSEEGILLANLGASEKPGIGCGIYDLYRDADKIKEKYGAWYESAVKTYKEQAAASPDGKDKYLDDSGNLTGLFAVLTMGEEEAQAKRLEYGYFASPAPADLGMLNVLYPLEEAMPEPTAGTKGLALYDNVYYKPIDITKSSVGTRPFRFSRFTPEEKLEIQDIQTNIDTKAKEYMAKFVTGQIGFDQWDKYIEELKGLGLDKLLETYNSGYQRYMGNKK